MPNWVYNTIVCEEDVAKKILRMNEEMNKYEFSYNTIIPQPKSKEECDPKYYVTEASHICIEDEHPWLDWYKWNCDNWGVKWDACDVIVYPGVEYKIEFCSPWDAPERVLRKLCEMFPGKVYGNVYEEANNFNPYNWESLDSGTMDKEELEVEDEEEDWD